MRTKVENMTSNRSGSSVKNQFIIRTENKTYFQSYNSIIVMIDEKGQTFLDEKFWNFSRTTLKYRNKFLGETTEETRAKIDSGEYKLIDLNN